jgi:hypothetical protein
MPYSAEISRSNPACIVLVIDQSGSMADNIGGEKSAPRKSEFLADVVNRVLHDLVIRCTKAEEIREYFHVALIGYGAAGAAVEPAFSGRLSGKRLAKISEIGEYPARLENRTKKVPDGAGGLVDQSIRFPVWLDARAENGTPMCAALSEVHALVSTWVQGHPHGFPPIVLHITDGESGDGDPTSVGESIQRLGTADGNVLLFNCHLSSERAPKVEYPMDPSGLPNALARTLLGISSPLPPEFAAAGRDLGLTLAEGAKGFVFNADATSLVHFFDIGTRPSNR